MSYQDQDHSGERRELTQWVLWAVALILILGAVFKVVSYVTKPVQLLDRVTNPDHIIESYEEFEKIYATCNALCVQIADLREVSEDPSYQESAGFNSADRRLALKNKLTRWVADYNAKSRMITRNNWKARDLPYSLDIKSICQ